MGIADNLVGIAFPQVHTGTAPRAMASFRNLTIGVLKTAGATNMAKTTRAIRDGARTSPPEPGHQPQSAPFRDLNTP
ncbi:hypothetical protein [Streptomyces sp. NPDC102462]|uniref:hypothetical protein n=1 Tax=Streptomyces sp. NPDC102462 TaxID=3366178 RepID=UPI0038091784